MVRCGPATELVVVCSYLGRVDPLLSFHLCSPRETLGNETKRRSAGHTLHRHTSECSGRARPRGIAFSFVPKPRSERFDLQLAGGVLDCDGHPFISRRALAASSVSSPSQ